MNPLVEGLVAQDTIAPSIERVSTGGNTMQSTKLVVEVSDPLGVSVVFVLSHNLMAVDGLKLRVDQSTLLMVAVALSTILGLVLDDAPSLLSMLVGVLHVQRASTLDQVAVIEAKVELLNHEHADHLAWNEELTWRSTDVVVVANTMVVIADDVTQMAK
ncbi:hypothetical protein GUJ93_ZPchr0015g6870 [Zizania palustris]|uniref:Uncharacterized protein n=1 Tax=Zizania palustris TaxID=103762 RepID=A0A8J5W625_ZIZPA|nr:hypothetical protein GUJ93_ZPchr0015g6870 [Zizania palustris]